MRHRKAGRKFGRNSAHRKAMFRNMTTSLLKHGTIKTTLAKAKELRRHVEPVITIARKHVWANYAADAQALADLLPTLEGLFASASTAQKSSYDVVVKSQAQVEKRFPTGLGALLKSLKELGADEEQMAVVTTARNAQMARFHALSQAASTVMEQGVLDHLFDTLGEEFAGRNGGYTRVVKAGNREGDNAPMAYIALVSNAEASAEEVEEDAE
jgi:ribosomal protein L17